MKRESILILLILANLTGFPQSFKDSILWKNPTKSVQNEIKLFHFNFKNAIFQKSGDLIPEYQKKINVSLNSKIDEIKIENIIYISLNKDEIEISKQTEIKKLNFNYTIERAKNDEFVVISFLPVVKTNSGTIKKIKSFNISYKLSKNITKQKKTNVYVDNSVLSSGKWLKVGIKQDGVYKLTYSELSSYGIASDDGVKVYTEYSSILPEIFYSVTSDDLKEVAVVINKGSDGIFNSGDYILFYANGPNTWTPNYTTKTFKHKLHNFSTTNYIYITPGVPTEIQTYSSISESEVTNEVSNFNDFKFHELETENLLRTGKMSVGENFIPTYNTYDFNFSFPNIESSEPTTVSGVLVGKSSELSNFKLTYGSFSKTVNISTVSSSGYIYAKKTSFDWDFNTGSSSIKINITYNNSESDMKSEGWLDYLEVNAMRKLIFSGDQMKFRNINTVGTGNITKYNLSNISSSNTIWDVTNIFSPKKINFNVSNGNTNFIASSDSLSEYIIFNSNYLTPISFNLVQNQNLHNLGNYDMIIISHPNFNTDANTLANIHINEDNMTVKVINPTQIYNEFSSGKPDISAIRNFIKMLYEKSNKTYPKYLLLYGDGSYDNISSINSGNTNYLLTYQSQESLNSTGSYVSDDFYGLLDDGESVVSGFVDIGIGRIPVNSAAQSTGVLNKIKQYINKSSYGNWRNDITFIADDGDNNLHMEQADELSNIVKNSEPVYNIEKIYLDAYKQISTPAGERYPDVNKAFSNRMEKGALIVNYTGHGNELGLAHERVLSINEINAWSNFKKLPLFVTATCEFSRWDDNTRTSAGEYVFLNSNGGSIAMLTTTRLVYASQNFVLNQAFYNYTFGKRDYTLGDIVRITKNNAGTSVNKRNFSLLGDPALKLPYADYNIITTKVNNTALPNIDTLKALTKIEIEGEVINFSKSLSNYNGIVYPTIYDKYKSITTLGNGGAVPFNFSIQNNIIFKGKATVKEGKFKFSFIVPKDIAYNYGNGKISYYAFNNESDASGYNSDIIIGGTNDNPDIDDKGPDITIYINDNNFVYGGLTDETPILLSDLFDESGINTVGNGIGHDLSAIIDKNTSNSINLNEFYESETDNYKKGSLRYQLSKLSVGNHSLSVKAWDVYNNSSEEYIEFVVAESANLALDHIFNYPNPFSTNTDFYFDHNLPNANLNVTINIFTISGKLVKTLETNMTTIGYRSNPINWNGLDDYGDQLAKGVYIYKLSVKTDDGDSVEKIEKLVIIK